MRTSLCKGCRKPIVWAFVVKDGIRTGKRIPLDPRPRIYHFLSGPGIVDYEATPVSQDPTMVAHFLVTHFATCPNADQF